MLLQCLILLTMRYPVSRVSAKSYRQPVINSWLWGSWSPRLKFKNVVWCWKNMPARPAWEEWMFGGFWDPYSHSMGNPHRCPWQRPSRGPRKSESCHNCCSYERVRGRVLNDLRSTPTQHQFSGSTTTRCTNCRSVWPSSRNKWAAPVVAQRCCIPIVLCYVVSSLAFICAHICGRLRSNMSTKRWWSKTWLVSTCWNKARQATNWFMEQVDAILSLQRVALSSFPWYSSRDHPLYPIWWRMSVPWCFEISLVFFHLARMPLSEFPGLAATVRNRDRMTTTRKGQTESHAFRKPSRRNRSPPCWTCGSWLMCFACKSESETVKTTQDMEDRCGKHMNTSISRSWSTLL